jgi:hypothetical protein
MDLKEQITVFLVQRQFMFKMRKATFIYFKHYFSHSLRIFFIFIICIWENLQNLLSLTLSFPAHLLADDRGDNETVAIHSSGEIPCRVHQSVCNTWKQLID